MLTARFESDQPRKTLRAAGARDQSQLHFGERDLRVGQRHAIVAAQRELEPAAHAGAADGGDDRLGRRFDGIDHRRQEGLGVERAAGEFLDVGATREGAFAADEHDGAHLGVRQRAIERGHDAARAARATARSAADCSWSSQAMPVSTL